MKLDEFNALRAQAQTLFDGQTRGKGKATISLDTIFLALAARADAPKVMVRRVSEDAAPDWFSQTLEKLREAGERFTVPRFLMLAGKFPATRSDSINVARWLREAGMVPRKTGGQLVFEFD